MKTLNQILTAYVPGMTEITAMKETKNLAMHGAYAQGQELILIMENRHRLNTRFNNHGSTDYAISTEKIDHIEVLRGPASSLYGNVAVSAVVNIITKNADDINRIIKPFYWRYPLLRFVTFRAISDESRADFAERLKESAITVWVDERTNIGLAAVEAIRCGNIVIGKIPDNIPEWMGDDTHIYDNGIWFAKMSQIPDILSSVITSWMKDDVPVELTDAMEVTSKMYRQEDWNANIEKVFDELVNDRIKEIEPMLESVKNNTKKDEE